MIGWVICNLLGDFKIGIVHMNVFSD